MPQEAVNKINMRDNFKKSDPESPMLKQLNKEIENTIRDHNRKLWRDKLSQMVRKKNSGELFKLIKN